MNSNSNTLSKMIAAMKSNQTGWKLPSDPVLKSSPELMDWINTGKDPQNVGTVFIIKNNGIFDNSTMDCVGAVTFGRMMRENTQAPASFGENSGGNDFDDSAEWDWNDCFDNDDWVSEERPFDPEDSADEGYNVNSEDRKVLIAVGEVSENTNSKDESELRVKAPEYAGADAVLFRGSVDKHEKEFFDGVKKFINKVDGKCLIFICVDGFSDENVKRLEFENDAVLLTLNGMGMPYYKAVLAEVCKEDQVELDESLSAEDIILGLKRHRGRYFGVEDIKTAFKKAERAAAFDSRIELGLEDFKFMEEAMPSIDEEWQDLVGLKRPKELIARFVAMAEYELKRYGVNGTYKHKNLAFAGNPGVGKSEVIKRMSKICSYKGVTNGKVIFANKSSIVGKYVGHTASKVKKLFEDARGGILVFDEAGCLLVEDDFTKEALTEITRYMELYPDVLCIFASYKDSIRQLLQAEAGLNSRISQTVEFEDYTDEELYEILEKMLKKYGYVLEDSRESFFRYVDLQKQKSRDNWGNARLSRNVSVKLQEIAAVDALSACIEPADVSRITVEQAERAIEELIEESMKEDEHGKIGFAC